MLWPLWVALALAVAAATRGRGRLTAFMIAVGLLAMQILSAAVPHDWRYLASAMLWVSVGAASIRCGLALPGALLVLSGLCYFAAEVVAAAWEIGTPSLVAADSLGVCALMGVALHGRTTGLAARRPVGGFTDRRDLVAGHRHCPDQTQTCAPVTEAST